MYLLEETLEAAEMRQRVVDLLMTYLPENVELACQLIEGGGMHPQFILPMWAAYYRLEGEEEHARPLWWRVSALAPILRELQPLEDTRLGKLTIANVLQMQGRLEEQYPQDCDIQAFIRHIYPLFSYRQDYFDEFYQRAPHMAAYMLRCKIEGTILYFHQSKLPCLPAEIGEFPQLKRIDISGSRVADVPESFFTLKELIQLDYNRSALHKNQARLKEIKQRMPILEAMPICQKAQTRYHEGRYAAAAKKMKEVVALCPDREEFWSWYGETHRMAEAYEEAGKGFARVLERKPKDGWAWSKLAEIYCSQKKYTEALQMCETYLQNPANFASSPTIESDIWFVKGLTFFWLKEYDESIIAYKNSLALHHYAGTLYNLACSYSKMGAREDMLHYLRKSFETDAAEYVPFCQKDRDKDFKAFYEDEDFKALLAEFAGE